MIPDPHVVMRMISWRRVGEALLVLRGLCLGLSLNFAASLVAQESLAVRVIIAGMAAGWVIADCRQYPITRRVGNVGPLLAQARDAGGFWTRWAR